MKKGINHWCFGNMKLDDSFKLAKKYGFEGIEVNIDEGGEINLNSNKEDIKKILKSANKQRIEITSLSSGLFWKYQLTSNDGSIRNKAKQIIKKMIDVAVWLEVNVILVVPGKVSEEVRYDVAYERAQKALKEIATYAEKKKVFIGIENVWNKFLLTPLEMVKFIDGVNSDYVKSYFDVGNVLVSGYPEHWIKILGKRIKKVHIKDFRTDIGNIRGFVHLLAGDVNWPNVLKSLKEIGYNDYLIAELDAYKYYNERMIESTSQNMDKILKR